MKKLIVLAALLMLAWPLSSLAAARGGGGGSPVGGVCPRLGVPVQGSPGSGLGGGDQQRLRLRDGSCLQSPQTQLQTRDQAQDQTRDRDRTQDQDRLGTGK